MGEKSFGRRFQQLDPELATDSDPKNPWKVTHKARAALAIWERIGGKMDSRT
jgi:hypothetical protein